MLDWLIIGGGIQGTYLSHYLLHKRGVGRACLRVLDPYPQALARWTQRTQNVGMAYLRSPRVHHLDLSPASMDSFGETWAKHASIPPYLGAYRRPAYALFQAHSFHTIAHYQLEEVRLQGTALGLRRRNGGGWCVESDQGSLVSRRVVLALGRHTPVYPAWAQDIKGALAYHVFDPAFCLDHLPQGGHVAVIGGGISAAQTALHMAQRAAHVHLITRHRLRVRDFDSAAGWMGPKYLDSFKKKDLVRRRELIRRARNVGSVPSDVLNALDRVIRQRHLTLHQDEVSAASPQEGGGVALHLAAHGVLQVEALIYATGLETRHIEGAWLQTACLQEGLPLAPCGFPALTPRLAWAEGLYVMGHLAELEVGPVAPNIIGARMAAERIGRDIS